MQLSCWTLGLTDHVCNNLYPRIAGELNSDPDSDIEATEARLGKQQQGQQQPPAASKADSSPPVQLQASQEQGMEQKKKKGKKAKVEAEVVEEARDHGGGGEAVNWLKLAKKALKQVRVCGCLSFLQHAIHINAV